MVRLSHRPIYLFVTALLFTPMLHAEVRELSNTEMTEAYIQDGTIVIKHRAVNDDEPKRKVNIKVGPGEPAVAEADTVTDLQQDQRQREGLVQQELTVLTSEQQLRNQEQTQALSSLSIASYQSDAQFQQQQLAEGLVRQGLGLPEGTEITTDMMVQYLQGFSGQSVGDPLGAQQTITNTGIQIIMPNPGGQIETGVYPSGDQSMNVNANNQQIIFNLLFPQQQNP